MAAAAVRAGLVAALAGILVAGGAADATETPPMTRQETSALRKEITAKYKVLEEELLEIYIEAGRVYREGGNTLTPALHDAKVEAERKILKAEQKFLDGLRACLDGVNAESPGRVDAGAGSLADTLFSKANTTVSKLSQAESKEAQKVQAAARKACEPVTILIDPAPLVFNYAGPPGTGPVFDQHIRQGNLDWLALDSQGTLRVVGTFRCLAPHAHIPACDPDTAELVVTSPLGTQSAVVNVSEGVGAWVLEVEEGSGLVLAQIRHTKDGETSGFDDSASVFRVTVAEVSDGECPPNAGTLNGSPFAIDTLFDANRILYPDRTTLNLNYVTYPYVAGGEVLIQINLQHSDGTSGMGSVPVLIGPTPTGESWVRIYIQGSAVQGTLDCNDLAAILFDSGPGPLGFGFVSTDGTTTLDLCETKEDVPLLDGSSLKAAPPAPPRKPASPPK